MLQHYTFWEGMVWICFVIGLYFMISVEFGGLRLTNRNTACTTGSGIWKSRVLNACFLDNCQTSVFVMLTFFDLFVFYLLMWYQIICYEQNIKEYILSEFHWNILDNFGNSDLVCFSKIKLDIVFFDTVQHTAKQCVFDKSTSEYFLALNLLCFCKEWFITVNSIRMLKASLLEFFVSFPKELWFRVLH